MALPLATVGGKITAAIFNALVGAATAQGTTLVVPTSVAVAGGTRTVSALGKVTFTAATSLNVNGCFTSTYDNYLIQLDIPTASVALDVAMLMRVGGVDDGSAVYDNQRLSGKASVADAVQTLAATNWPVSASTQTIHDIELSIYRPALVVATVARGELSATTNPMTATAAVAKKLLLHRTAQAFDGFSIVPNTGTITGTVRVYGYNNG